MFLLSLFGKLDKRTQIHQPTLLGHSFIVKNVQVLQQNRGNRVCRQPSTKALSQMYGDSDRTADLL
ncbi:hypothetical protein PAXY110619_18500 [Paenibacillus xylanexedens]